MFRILTRDDYQTSPWKNGGGVTHEIARHPDGDDWQWRISIAEVASDGPFSIFEGMSRILTVISGDGVDLHGPHGVIEARLGEPVGFSGDLPVTSRLVNGPIRDLNVIYDGTAIDAKVTVLEGPDELTLGPENSGCLALAGQISIDVAEVPVGAFVLGTSGRMVLESGAGAILVSLRDLPLPAKGRTSSNS